MKTKEKLVKLIFLIFLSILFLCLFSACYKVFGVATEKIVIDGTVKDENGAPIPGLTVEYGGVICNTDSSGKYKVEIPKVNASNKIKYNFQPGNEFEAVLKATSTIIVPEPIQPGEVEEEYNIVIVKPENGYESECQEIEQMINNCKLRNKEIITYDNINFKYNGTNISNPYDKYCEIFDNCNCINMFIVIGTKDMPNLGNVPAGTADLWKGNIFYNIDILDLSKIPQNMQVNKLFDQIKNWIKEFGDVQKVQEELLPEDELIETSHVILKLNQKKSQTIELELRRVPVLPAGGDFISGIVYLDEEGTRSKINKNKYGKELSHITVELINVDTNTSEGNPKSIGTNEKYGFAKPAPGHYKLIFKYNGQEFKAIEEATTNVTTPNTKDSHIQTEIDRAGFNNKNNSINNSKMKQIIEWDEANDGNLINMYAESVIFEVKEDIPDNPLTPYIDETYIDPDKYINLVLEKRDFFEIEFKKEIDRVKVTLSDGQIYEERLSKNHGTTNEQIDMRQVIMDEELMHGATIEIEYVITAKSNNPNIDIQGITVIEYLDYENNNLEYYPHLETTVEPIKRNEQMWLFENKNNPIYQDYVEPSLVNGNEADEELKDREYLLGNLQDMYDGTFQTRLVVTKMISSALDEEDLLYSNSTEIIKYSNSEGRRMKLADETVTSIDERKKDKNIPGNFNPSILNIDSNYADNAMDISVAEDVFIIPPFGGTKNVFTDLTKYVEQKEKFFK